MALDLPYVVICESELDAAVLLSHGIPGISTTGGASTIPFPYPSFKEKQIFICFDNDLAGIHGAFKFQGHFDAAKLMWLPDVVGESGDITDFFVYYGDDAVRKFEYLMDKSSKYAVNSSRFSSNNTMLAKSEYNKRIQNMQTEMYERTARGLSTRYCEFYISEQQRLIQECIDEQAKKRKRRRYETHNDEGLLRAKRVPVDHFVNFNQKNFATSVWKPNEKTPSMYYYRKQNRVWCYSSGRGGDVIDVVEAKFGLSTKEAIDYINDQYYGTPQNEAVVHGTDA